MSIFVKQTDTFTVNLVVGFAENQTLVCTEESGQHKTWGEKVSAGENLTFTFRYPNYKDNVEIVDKSVVMEDGKLNFKTAMLRYYRLIKLIQSWNLKENGKDVPVNQENIEKLHPAIASALAEEMDKVLEVY